MTKAPKRARRRAPATAILMLALGAATFVVGAAGVTAGTDTAAKSAVEISEWLVLGPLDHPLPAFHDDTRGSWEVKDLLDSEALDPRLLQPAAGRAIHRGLDIDPRWVRRSVLGSGKAPRKGTVEIAPAAKDGVARHPQVAWLAVYLDVSRFAEFDFELRGDQPRRAWLDGAPLVQGGLEESDEVEGPIALVPGKHLLLIQTVRDPSRETAWHAGARLTADVAGREAFVMAALTPQRQVDILDITDAPSVESLAISPDGSQVATTVRRRDRKNAQYESWIEIRDTAAGEVLESWREPAGVSGIDWSPDGRYLSWVVPVAAADPPQATLFLKERGSGRRVAFLDGVERLGAYAWAPDGRTLVFQTTVPAEKDERGVKRVAGLMDRWASFRDKQFLSLADVPAGIRRRLTAGGASTTFEDFSPDGTRMLVTRRFDDPGERPYSRTELWEIALEDLAARKLRDFRWLNAASYAPDGRELLVSAQPTEFGDVGVDLPEGVIANSYDAQLFVWNPSSDAVRTLSREFDPAIGRAVWSRRDGNIYLVASERDRERLFRYVVARGAFEPIDVGRDVVHSWDLAESADRIVALASSAWEPPGLVRVGTEGGSSRRLAHPADDWFADVGRGTMEDWEFTSSRGARIEGRVYLPPGFDRDRRYPAIVYYYGGTVATDRSFGGRYPKEWWAARGYVVYVPQPSGATGFGQSRSAVHVNDWGEIAAEEILEGTRKFLEAHPFVDPGRVGCIGASYGGFMTMLLSTKTDLYRAAVAHAGISSLASYWGEGYWGYSYSSVASANSFPWNRPDLYVDHSPLFRADQARVPILLTHGRSDTNVPVGESDAFFVALKLLGKNVEYVQVEGEDHWIVERDKRVLWSRTIVAWFERWLSDRPEWWFQLYPDSETAAGAVGDP